MLLALLACILPFPKDYGDFTITGWDFDTIHVIYEGDVTDDDAGDLRRLMEDCHGLDVHITIESGGGSAWGGLYLYEEAEKWDNLTTIAGSKFGAWSAAALFWLGSPVDIVAEGGFVGFHAAYCLWWAPPGCDTSEFMTAFARVLIDEFGMATAFALVYEMNFIQRTYGVSHWVGIASFEDGTMGWATWSTNVYPPVYIPWG